MLKCNSGLLEKDQHDRKCIRWLLLTGCKRVYSYRFDRVVVDMIMLIEASRESPR